MALTCSECAVKLGGGPPNHGVRRKREGIPLMRFIEKYRTIKSCFVKEQVRGTAGFGQKQCKLTAKKYNGMFGILQVAWGESTEHE